MPAIRVPPALAIVSAAEPSLSELAEQINDAHTSSEGSLRDGVRHALACGRLLCQARLRQRKRYHWVPWLKANIRFPLETCQRYMRISRNWSQIEAQVEHPEKLTARQCIEILTTSKPKPPERPVLAESREAISEAYIALDEHLRATGDDLSAAAAMLSEVQFFHWIGLEFSMSPATAGQYQHAANSAARGHDPVGYWMDRKPDLSDFSAGEFSYSELGDQNKKTVLRRLARQVSESIAGVRSATEAIGSRLSAVLSGLPGEDGRVLWNAFLSCSVDMEPALAESFMKAALPATVGQVPESRRGARSNTIQSLLHFASEPEPEVTLPESGRRRKSGPAPKTAPAPRREMETPPRMAELIYAARERDLTPAEEQELIDLDAAQANAAQAESTNDALGVAVGGIKRKVGQTIDRVKTLAEAFPDRATGAGVVRERLQSVLLAISEHLER